MDLENKCKRIIYEDKKWEIEMISVSRKPSIRPAGI
jgi:hypothetical protein